MTRALSGLAVMVSGCGDNSPTIYELTTPFTPVFVTYRVDGHRWEIPSSHVNEDGTNTYDLSVSGPFLVVVTCTRDAGGFFTQELHAAPSEINLFNDWLYPCPAFTEPATAQVAGQMDEAGSIAIGSAAQSSAAAGSWSFQLAAPLGINDLVATTTGRILVQHGLDVQGETQLPPIDLSMHGDPMDYWDPELHGVLPNELVATNTSLLTVHDAEILLAQRGVDVPSTQRVAGDTEWMTIWVHSSSGDRYVNGRFAGAPRRDFDLMPPLSGVTFSPTTTSASWDVLPDGYEWAEVIASDGTNFESLTAGAAWIDQASTKALDFEPDVPGLDPAWRVAAPTDGESFQVWRTEITSDVVNYGTSVGGAGIPVAASQLRRMIQSRQR